MFVVTAEEMREIDRRTIEVIGIPGVVLMENAGAQVAEQLRRRIPNHSKICILAGHGNNGGDGFVIARHLMNNEFQVKVWFIGDELKLSEDSRIHFHALINMEANLKPWNSESWELFNQELNNADVIVDALLGTGARGGLRDPHHSIIKVANQAKAYKVAVDMPTGVNSDTGEVIDGAFKADLTVTFALPKLGQLIYPGADYIGELEIVDISIPKKILQELSLHRKLLMKEDIKAYLPIRKPYSHKGTYGHAVIIGGSAHMPGAPTLATKASLRSGAGLTTIIIPQSIQNMVFQHLPEAICVGAEETKTGHFSMDSLRKIKEQKKATAFGIGPGLGNWEQAEQWLATILAEIPLPIVLDADALNIIASNLERLRKRKAPTIITPHPGEMARLIQREIAFVEQNRVQVALEFAKTYGVFVVLKGANSVIATPEGEFFINPTGGPELAKGGSGDVLTGMITGLLAQQIPVKNAVLAAVYLHGLSGSLASTPSNYSTLATDIIDKISSALFQVSSN